MKITNKTIYMENILFIFYLIISFSMYFYINSLSLESKYIILKYLDGYINLELGGYTELDRLYSILLNNFLVILTPVCIFAFYSFQKKIKVKVDGLRDFISCLIGFFVSLYFMLSNWKLFSSSVLTGNKEIFSYTLLICSIHIIFIGCCWHLPASTRWTYRFIKYILKRSE